MAVYEREGHYDRVGPIALDVSVDFEAAERLRALGTLGAPCKSLEIDEDRTTIRTSARASGLLSEAWGDYRVSELQFYSRTTLQSNPDAWATMIAWTKYRDSQRDVKIMHRVESSVLEGEVMSARHKIYVARDVASVALANEGGVVQYMGNRQYKMFERPLEVREIDEIEHTVHSIVARAAIGRHKWNI